MVLPDVRRQPSSDGSSSTGSAAGSPQPGRSHDTTQQPGVFLRGLKKGTDPEQLKSVFKSYGVSSVQVFPGTSATKSADVHTMDTAYVNFYTKESAQQVLDDYTTNQLYIEYHAVTVDPKDPQQAYLHMQQLQQHTQLQNPASSSCSNVRRTFLSIPNSSNAELSSAVAAVALPDNPDLSHATEHAASGPEAITAAVTGAQAAENTVQAQNTGAALQDQLLQVLEPHVFTVATVPVTATPAAPLTWAPFLVGPADAVPNWQRPVPLAAVQHVHSAPGEQQQQQQQQQSIAPQSTPAAGTLQRLSRQQLQGQQQQKSLPAASLPLAFHTPAPLHPGTIQFPTPEMQQQQQPSLPRSMPTLPSVPLPCFGAAPSLHPPSCHDMGLEPPVAAAAGGGEALNVAAAGSRILTARDFEAQPVAHAFAAAAVGADAAAATAHVMSAGTASDSLNARWRENNRATSRCGSSKSRGSADGLAMRAAGEEVQCTAWQAEGLHPGFRPGDSTTQLAVQTMHGSSTSYSSSSYLHTERAQRASRCMSAAACEAAVVFEELEQLRIQHAILCNCLRCGEEPRSAVLLPCKHLTLCDSCCLEMLQAPKEGERSVDEEQEKQQVAGRCQCPICGAAVLDSIMGVILPM